MLSYNTKYLLSNAIKEHEPQRVGQETHGRGWGGVYYIHFCEGLLNLPAKIVSTRKTSEEVFPVGVFPLVARLWTSSAGELAGSVQCPEAERAVTVGAGGSIERDGQTLEELLV